MTFKNYVKDIDIADVVSKDKMTISGKQEMKGNVIKLNRCMRWQ